MEAKVDLRKLQLLNDRICQTIDALNQVRLSVHGLSHTAGVPGIPYAGIPGAIPQTTPYGAGFQHTTPWYGVQPNAYGMPFNPGIGLQHSPAAMQQFGAPQFGVPQFGVPQFGVPQFVPSSINPWFAATQMNGLAHTNPEIFEQQLVAARAADPLRLSQSFPLAFTSY